MSPSSSHLPIQELAPTTTAKNDQPVNKSFSPNLRFEVIFCEFHCPKNAESASLFIRRESRSVECYMYAIIGKKESLDFFVKSFYICFVTCAQCGNLKNFVKITFLLKSYTVNWFHEKCLKCVGNFRHYPTVVWIEIRFFLREIKDTSRSESLIEITKGFVKELIFT